MLFKEMSCVDGCSNFIFYNGRKGKEYKVKEVEESDYGKIIIEYIGPKGEERMVKMIDPHEGTSYYRGAQGKEYKVKLSKPNGDVTKYKGEAGKETKVETINSNGKRVVVKINTPGGNIIYRPA